MANNSEEMRAAKAELSNKFQAALESLARQGKSLNIPQGTLQPFTPAEKQDIQRRAEEEMARELARAAIR